MAGKSSTKQIGDWEESQAAAWLERNGYQVLDRNLYTPYGEIDILARKQSRLIFVEVKTRRTKYFGAPEEAITDRKLQHLVESVEHFLQEHPDLEADWQINVIAIQHNPKTKKTEIVQFENVS